MPDPVRIAAHLLTFSGAESAEEHVGPQRELEQAAAPGRLARLGGVPCCALCILMRNPKIQAFQTFGHAAETVPMPS